MNESKEKQWIFKAEEMFEDIPNDPKNVNMSIPPEVAEHMGWQPGDKLKILWGDQGTIIIEKAEETDEQG